jgi:hypothetical protein
MKRAMAMATRVAGDKEGNGDGGKSDCNGNKDGRRVTATRVMVTRVAVNNKQQEHGADDEGSVKEGKGGKGNGDGNEDGGH